MNERSRTARFDEVFQIVLIIVALSFDILWFFGYTPIAEIAVFIFALVIWATGNLLGGEWEYALKLGSFNFSLILLTNFYFFAALGRVYYIQFWELIMGTVVLPVICFIITSILVIYLKDYLNRRPAFIFLINTTLGYIIATYIVTLLESSF